MKLKQIFLITAALFFSSSHAMAASEEELLGKKLQELYPSTKITGVFKTGFEGMYEVDMGKNIGYTNKEGQFFLFGHIFDMKHQQDLTQQRLDALNVIDFAELPLKDAIKTVKGNGKRVMAVFSDPDCPYCKRLEPDLAKLDNVTIYTFLMPLDGLHPEASKKAKNIWCAPNKAAAWHDYMLDSKTPAEGKVCDNPIDRNVQLGQKLNINGTPTMIAADGRVLPGAAPIEQIEQWLGKGGN